MLYEMAACGVPQRLAQAHMRHTDPRLTSDVYCDESLLPIAAAIASLPALPTGPVMPATALRMTGTCDEGAAQRHSSAHVTQMVILVPKPALQGVLSLMGVSVRKWLVIQGLATIFPKVLKSG